MKGDFMNNDIKYILRMILGLLITGFIVFIVIKLFIYILPVIAILIIGYYLYILYKQGKFKLKKKVKERKERVPEAEILNERFDK